MATAQTPKHAATPPKGKPTRARGSSRTNRGAFGATAQWITFVIVLVVAFVLAVWLLRGGDFQDDTDTPGLGNTAPAGQPFGVVVAAEAPQPSMTLTF